MPALSSPLSVREVVEQGRYVHARRRYRFQPLDHMATEHALRRTDVLSLSSRPFTRLSRGEQQRVMLARALCTQARILCLDEPTASLDVAHALEFYELLRTLRGEGYALVVVLHQLGDARRFGDRALMLSVDQSVRLGPVRDVVSREPVRRVYGVNLREDAGLEFDLLRAEGGTAR
jgi:iron complex transport system ATP-binding protein